MKIIIVILVIIVLYFIITLNRLIKLKNKVREAFSTMDIYLKKRWDLVPNLVETVKGYSMHEQKTLEDITKLRTSSYEQLSNDEKMNSSIQLKDNIEKIMVLAENYPDLKASENFKELSKQLITIENEIANSRKYYNAYVREYNNKIEMFPSSIVAKLFGYETYKMFEADSKENIKINYTKE